MGVSRKLWAWVRALFTRTKEGQQEAEDSRGLRVPGTRGMSRPRRDRAPQAHDCRTNRRRMFANRVRRWRRREYLAKRARRVNR